jgi:hypothetical protein
MIYVVNLGQFLGDRILLKTNFFTISLIVIEEKKIKII